MYNPNGSRVEERRRSPSADHHQTAASTSTYVRGIYPPQRPRTQNGRSNSLPASSYFLATQGDDDSEPQPIMADAESHFAYSTTLRRQRYNYELTSPTSAIQKNWQGALDSFSRQRQSLDQQRPSRVPYLSNVSETQKSAPGTPSSKFSHSTVEV